MGENHFWVEPCGKGPQLHLVWGRQHRAHQDEVCPPPFLHRCHRNHQRNHNHNLICGREHRDEK